MKNFLEEFIGFLKYHNDFGGWLLCIMYITCWIMLFFLCL